jgi:hypothetical protein
MHVALPHAGVRCSTTNNVCVHLLCCACYYCEQVGAAFGEACVDQGAAVMAQSQLQRLYWEQHMQAQQMQRGALAALQQRQQFQFQVSTVSTAATTTTTTCHVMYSRLQVAATAVVLWLRLQRNSGNSSQAV